MPQPEGVYHYTKVVMDFGRSGPGTVLFATENEMVGQNNSGCGCK